MSKSISDSDFYQLKDFIYIVSNIELGENKKYLVEQRLEPILDSYNLVDYSDLIKKLTNPPKNLIDDVISAITTNETSFFRDNHVFKAIESKIIPELFEKAKTSKVTIWSAACSTGQEPYTLAMLITDYANKNHLQNLLSKFTIKASDLDNNVLNKAKKGQYSALEIGRGLPNSLKEKYFEKISDKLWEVKQEIKKMVLFNRMNLINPGFYPANVDLTLCRNVLIYFDEYSKKDIIGHIYKALILGGYFFVGSSESLYGLNNDFKREEIGMVTVYQK